MSVEENKAIVYDIFEAINNGDLDALDKYYSVDCIGHSPPYGKVVGLSALKSAWNNHLRGFPDTQVNVKEVIAEGDAVTARVTIKGTNTGQFAGRITGKEGFGLGLILYHMDNGKIVEEWDHWDELGMWWQLGHRLDPPIVPNQSQS